VSRRGSGGYRRPSVTTSGSSRAVRAQTARLRTERDTRPRRVDATVTPDSMALRTRASAVLLLFFCAWAVLAVRAGYLAVGPDTRLSDRLIGQHERVVEVAPQRGSIVDRLGRPLAVGVEMDSVFADPTMVEDPDGAAELLAPLLDSDVDELRQRLAREGTRFVWLARQVPTQVADSVHSLDIPGVRITAEAHRDYPSGPLAAQTLGFVGTEGTGLEGLEARFDSLLMGDVVQYRILRDGRRRPVNHEAVLSRRSTEGHTLVLTLDHSIQHRAEVALEAAVDKHEARAGWVIVLDVQTGAVLAMASAPSFDPNHFRGVDPERFRSKITSEVFEPGSVMKPFVVAEVIERGLATPEEQVYCERGAYRIGRRTVHDTHSYEHITVQEIIKFSSNIGVSKLGERLGPAALEETYRKYGFGARTGIELREEKGILHPSSSWSRIGFATHTFGQGMAVTPLQLAAGFAALVNGGVRVQPHLVAEVRDGEGAVVEDRRPDVGERVISEDASATIRVMLGMVNEEGGTGTRAALAEYTSGGKTGTAQKVKDGRYAKSLYVSSYIGVAPLDDPRLVVLATLDEPRRETGYYGGTVGGPVFKEVMTHALHELGVKPDREVPTLLARDDEEDEAPLAPAEDEPTPDPEAEGPVVLAGEGPWEMPDLTGSSLRDAVAVLGPSGVALELDGSGLVFEQQPAPGEPLAADGTVRLALALRGKEDAPR
jgi:cell division protein FtsI (penicillin-binding protein 3)